MQAELRDVKRPIPSMPTFVTGLAMFDDGKHMLFTIDLDPKSPQHRLYSIRTVRTVFGYRDRRVELKRSNMFYIRIDAILDALNGGEVK
jgi:hypothetical protein